MLGGATWRRGGGWRATVAIAVGMAAAAGAAGPARAQVGASVELGGVKLSVTGEERKALGQLGETLRGSNPGAQDSALAAARRVVKGRDARHWLALLQLELGRLRKDDALRAEALDLLLESGLTRREKLPEYLDVRGGIAFRARDFATARSYWTRLLEMKPNDPDVLANLAQVQVALGDARGASELLERAIGGREGSGKPPSAVWYRQRLAVAQQAGQTGPAAAAGRALVAAYPTPGHWRDALVVYRQLAAPAGGLEIDLMRLTRAVGALTKAEEYLRMAQLLRIAGQAAEAKAVLAEGLERGLLAAATSPTREIVAEVEREVPTERGRLAAARGAAGAESLAWAGRHDEAVALYRAALARGGADSGEINTRLGMALVRRGGARRRRRPSGPLRQPAGAMATSPSSG